jgi:chaperone modulatory protein CbpM
MEKKELIIVADYAQDVTFTLHELCEICHLSPEDIQTFIEYDIIHPIDTRGDEWMFDIAHLQRLRTAIRLQRDLEVNLAGVGLVLELLDEMEQLRAQAALFEKHYLK